MQLRYRVSTALPFLLSFASVQAQNPVGCFSDVSGALQSVNSYTWQTYSHCSSTCQGSGSAVWGITQGSNCWCGNQLPASSSKTSDSSCSSICTGYGSDMCGGPSAWSVGLTGLNQNPGSVSSSSDNSNSNNKDSAASPSPSQTAANQQTQSASPTKVDASVVTHASTVVVTAPGQTAPQTTVISSTQTPKSKGSTNVAGIAAGVVVAVVAVAALAGGLFFYLRQRKRRAIEEEYRQNAAAASTFPNSHNSKGPLSSSASMSDSRLEPSVMMQRRMSDVSIADNQDYSRRILKVTNPDR